MNLVPIIQQELNRRGLYKGALDGIYGRRTDAAVETLLSLHRVPSRATWGDARQQVAAFQVMATERDIDAGAIDGLVGPQTRHAMEVWAARAANNWKPVPEVEEWRGNTDETQPSVPARPLPAPKVSAPRVASPRQSAVSSFYGQPGENQAMLVLPFPMRLAWDLDAVVTKFSCHEKVREALEYVFELTLGHYGIEQIRMMRLDLFGGCLNVRSMRGGSSLSMHAWGIAWDMDPDRNQLRWGRDKATLDGAIYDFYWSLVYATGAISLGREKNYDWMHSQFARV